MIVNHLASDVIGEFLREKNLGTNPSNEDLWPVFSGQLMPEPDEAIAVVDSGRPYQGRFHRTGETQGHLGFQVNVRAKKFADARDKTIEIWKAFDAVVRYEISVESTRYRIQSITNLMMPTWIGADPNSRVSYVLNCVTSFNEVQDE